LDLSPYSPESAGVRGLFVRGALANAVSQGIGVATGLQDEFDWTGVAVGGVVGGVTASVGEFLALNDVHGQLNDTLTGTASAIAGAATRSLIEGSDFGDNILAALPDVIGATIGSMVTSKFRFNAQPEDLTTGQSYAQAILRGMDRSDGGSSSGSFLVANRDPSAAGYRKKSGSFFSWAASAWDIVTHPAKWGPAISSVTRSIGRQIDYRTTQFARSVVTIGSDGVLELQITAERWQKKFARDYYAASERRLVVRQQTLDMLETVNAARRTWNRIESYSSPIPQLLLRGSNLADSRGFPGLGTQLRKGGIFFAEGRAGLVSLPMDTAQDLIVASDFVSANTSTEAIFNNGYRRAGGQLPDGAPDTANITVPLMRAARDPVGTVVGAVKAEIADWVDIGEDLASDDPNRYGPAAYRGAQKEANLALTILPGAGAAKTALSTAKNSILGLKALSRARGADLGAAERIPGRVTTLVERVDAPNPLTGAGYGVNNPPVRIAGEWSNSDIYNALYGRSPKGLGRPQLHHADQMPGSGIHEVLASDHLGNAALHPNKWNQGVTGAMRTQDTRLHWWYRAQEQGAWSVYPNHIYD